MLTARRIGFAFFLIALIATSLFVWGPFLLERPFLRIPIVFLQEKPCIRTHIEENEYLLELDSGSSGYLSLNQEVLDKIKNKTTTENRKWEDINGNKYESLAFSIEEINIGTFEIWNAIAFTESSDFINNGCKLIKQQKSKEIPNNTLDKIQGRIGLKILRILDYWLIDFPNSELVAIRDIEKITNKPGFSLSEFTEVALEQSENQIAVIAETDFGIKKLALDTGAYRSILNFPSKEFSNHQIVKSDHLIIKNKDFGGIEFYVFEIPQAFKIDGILGLDFFYKHAIYLDFKNNRAFIGPTIE